MADAKITQLSIFIEQGEDPDRWNAYFLAMWSDDSSSTWDVAFPGAAKWVAGDMTDDVWIGAVLRAATDGHQPTADITFTPAVPAMAAQVRAIRAQLSHVDELFAQADEISAGRTTIEQDELPIDVSRETRAQA